jgi:hypothetical protein
MLRRLLIGLLCCCALWLAGCAGVPQVTSQVSSYGSWPEGRQPGTYVFERLPSQQAQAERQDELEAAVQPVLAALGFKLVKPADAAKAADVSVQVASQVRVDPRPRYDPFRSPYGPGPYGPYGPYGRAGLGGWWGGRGGWSMNMSMEPPYVQMQVDVLIRDRRSNQVLYETHAVHERVGGADPALLGPMFEAALADFPHQAISPRTVTVTLPDDNH